MNLMSIIDYNHHILDRKLMSQFHFPKIEYHPSVARNVNELLEERSSFGQRSADVVASAVGSWRFIIIQSLLLVLWVILNVTGWVFHWDPYPFILMNLVLSTQAAFTAPVIMMSQNRQAARDRIEAHQDFVVDQQSEMEVRAILQQIEAQNLVLTQLYQMLSDLHAEKAAQEPPNNGDAETPQP